MNTLQKLVTSILFFTAFIAAIMQWPAPAVLQTDSQYVFRVEQSSATKETLYLYWPVYFGAAKIPLFTSDHMLLKPESPAPIIQTTPGKR